MKSKSTLINSNQVWNTKSRYKINEVVSHLGVVYQNITGFNSNPLDETDWNLIKSVDSPTIEISSGSYEPVLTGTLNVLEIYLDKAYYTRIGNIVNVNVGFFVNVTNGAVTSNFLISMPINKTTETSILVGSGAVQEVPLNTGVLLCQTYSSSTVNCVFVPPSNLNPYSGSVQFQYNILD